MFCKMLFRGALMVLTCIVAGATASKAAASEPTFASVVKLHYAEWTKTSPNKKLTADGVAKLVNNPKLRAEEAMAIAAIHQYFVQKTASQVVDEGFLLAPKNTNAQTTLANFQGNYSGFLNSLKTTPRVLFGKDAPELTGIHQGGVGDCYLVCTIGAMVTLHSQEVRNMIRPQKDGSYIVHFTGHQPIRVPQLTDAQIVLDQNTAGQQGLWIKVLGQAYAIDRWTVGGPIVKMDDLGGGSCIPIISLFTGQTQAQIRHLLPSVLAAKDKAGTEKAVERLMLEIHDHKLLACASTAGQSQVFSQTFNPVREGGKLGLNGRTTYTNTLPPGIAGDHAYAVLGYDPAKKLVTLWNPWGGSWQPTGAPGFTNGYPRVNGVFSVPLSDFVVIFHGFEVQDCPKTSAK